MKNIEKYKDIVLNDLNNCHIESSLKMLYGEEIVDCAHTHCGECKEHILKWLLSEYKGQVLDDVENEYLSAVIKPFRNRVKYIVKTYGVSEARQFIRIIMCDGEYSNLPFFKGGTMYKGMKVDKQYTLQELGL